MALDADVIWRIRKCEACSLGSEKGEACFLVPRIATYDLVVAKTPKVAWATNRHFLKRRYNIRRIGRRRLWRTIEDEIDLSRVEPGDLKIESEIFDGQVLEFDFQYFRIPTGV